MRGLRYGGNPASGNMKRRGGHETFSCGFSFQNTHTFQAALPDIGDFRFVFHNLFYQGTPAHPADAMDAELSGLLIRQGRKYSHHPRRQYRSHAPILNFDCVAPVQRSGCTGNLNRGENPRLQPVIFPGPHLIKQRGGKHHQRNRESCFFLHKHSTLQNYSAHREKRGIFLISSPNHEIPDFIHRGGGIQPVILHPCLNQNPN